MVNRVLLEDTMSHIRCMPELHSQSHYFEVTEFGMAACFGGRALLLAGYEPELNIDGTIGNMAVRPNGERVFAYREAMALLGLDKLQAINLFTAANTANMLERKVEDLLNGSPLETYRELVSVGS